MKLTRVVYFMYIKVRIFRVYKFHKNYYDKIYLTPKFSQFTVIVVTCARGEIAIAL